MRLHFKHVNRATLDGYKSGTLPANGVAEAVEKLTRRLQQDDLALSKLKHRGLQGFH